MKTLTVHVQGDHLQTLSRAKKPILAVAELIWNGLDADAKEVSVVIEESPLGALERVHVIDNGHGLAYQDAVIEFEKLGGSWKRHRDRSKGKGRFLHGRLGKGRFRAFALGSVITWKTSYADNGTTKKYEIIGRSDDLEHYHVSDPIVADCETGTEVLIENMHKNFYSLRGDSAVQEIASNFALYLRQYPDVSIRYDGHVVSTDHLEARITDFPIEGVNTSKGIPVLATLTVIEWRQPTDRSLFLCDSAGFSLNEIPAGIQAPGFSFTAYLKSDYLHELERDGSLELDELHPVLKQLVDSTRNTLRSHFRKRASEEASDLVQRWKSERIYPYESEPTTPVDVAERHVFDICALNVHSYLPDFADASQKSRHLALRLLRTALETNPAAIQAILSEVLGLPAKKQTEFAELLQKTSLDAIITASKAVANRLSFVRGLDLLLFDPESKKQLLERRQLHRILSEKAWIFGEEFNLTLDDQSLTELLKKHRKELGDEVDIVDEVRREDGSIGIVDLVLGRRIPTPRGEDREHLIVELKRPMHTLNDDSLGQVKSYAFAVAEDERFKDAHTRWSFWLIGNDMSSSVHRQANQKNGLPGCAHDDRDANMRIWVKTWGELLCDCEGRLKFFQEQLQFRADREDSLAYLRKEYEKYLPEVFQDKDTDGLSEANPQAASATSPEDDEDDDST